MEKIKKKIIKEKAIISIIIISVFVHIAFLSPWLEDWDSVQFSLALHNFDLGNNLPHAPGYPLYILLGKIFYLFTKSDIVSLNLMSAITGSIATFFVYLISKKMFDQKTAHVSSILFLITPISLIMSISPLTNMVGLCSELILIYLIWTRFERHTLSIAFLGGFILGFRTTELPIILSLLGIATLKHKKTSQLFGLTSLFLLGILSWVIPMLIATGFNDFQKAYRWITRYVIYHDSIMSQGILERIKKLDELLNISYTMFFVVLASLAFLIIIRKHPKNYSTLFLLGWLLAYSVPLLFIFNLEVPRYTLPLLPPFAIAVAYFLTHLTPTLKIPGYGLLFILIILLTKQSLSQAQRFHTTLPPSIAPVMYVKENFNPDDTTIIASYTYRQFQYYAPEYNPIYSQECNKKDFQAKENLILDYNGLTSLLPKDTQYNIINEVEYKGDKDIYSRLSETHILILKLNSD